MHLHFVAFGSELKFNKKNAPNIGNIILSQHIQ